MNLTRSCPVGLLMLGALALGAVLARRSTTRSFRGAISALWGTRPLNFVRIVLFPIGCAALAAVLFALLAPVRIIANTAQPAAPRIAAGDRADENEVAQRPSELSFKIVANADAPVTLITPPQLRVAALEGSASLRIDGWQASDQFDVLTSTRRGGSIEARGVFSSVDLRFVRHPGAGTVSVSTTGGREVSRDLRGAGGTEALQIGSGRTIVQEQRTFLGRSLTLDSATELTAVSAMVGLVDVEVVSERTSDGGSRVTVSPGSVASAVVDAHVRSLFILLVAVAVFAVAHLVGGAVAPPGWSSRRRDAILPRALVGMAVSMLVIGALNYVVPMRVAVLSIVPFVAVGGFRQSQRVLCAATSTGRAPRKSVTAPAVAAVFVALTLSHFVLTERWALGFLQTDVFDTFNLTVLFWDQSAFSASTDFGNGFRLLDYSTRAAIWGSALDRSSDAIVVLRLLFAALVIWMSCRVARRAGAGPLSQSLFAALAVFSSAFTSLWFQGYMSREFFVSWAILGLLAIIGTLQRDARDSWSWAELGTVCWISVAIVPPYSILVVGLLIAFVSHFRGSRRCARAGGRGLAISSLLLVPNLIWLRDAGDAERYVPTLNALTSNIVIPFLGSPNFPSSMLGLIPFHSNSEHVFGAVDWTLGPIALSSEALAGAVPLAVALVLLTVVLAVGATVGWRTNRAPTATLLAMLAAYLLGILALRALLWTNQLYFSAMFIWTLAPVAVVAAGLILVEATSGVRARPFVARSAIATLFALATVNVVSSAQDYSLWREGEFGPRAERWHGDQAGPLARFSAAVESGQLGLDSDHYAVTASLSGLTGTDDDRILVNGVVNVLESYGLPCANCVRDDDSYFAQALREPVPDDVYKIDVGGAPCEDRAEVWRDTYLVVCAPAL